jgi:hypothetical protein
LAVSFFSSRFLLHCELEMLLEVFYCLFEHRLTMSVERDYSSLLEWTFFISVLSTENMSRKTMKQIIHVINDLLQLFDRSEKDTSSCFTSSEETTTRRR